MFDRRARREQSAFATTGPGGRSAPIEKVPRHGTGSEKAASPEHAMTPICLDETVDLLLGEERNLRGLARGLTGCESDSDDLVQETLLRAYGARHRFRPGSSMRAWTTTILRRLFLTGVIRAKRRRLQTDTDAGGALETVHGRPASPWEDPAPDVESLADGLEDSVKHALDRVPEVYRTAYFLSVVREMSCEEIGHALRVPIGTVMSRIHRAREWLRNDLVRSPQAVAGRSRPVAMGRPSRSERAQERVFARS